MSKLIIKNKTEISDIYVLTLIKKVIDQGRVSNNNKQYCYLTSFTIQNKEYHMVTDLRKCSDVFTFYAVSKANEKEPCEECQWIGLKDKTSVCKVCGTRCPF